MKLLNYKNFILEKVDAEFLKSNPNFYLNKSSGESIPGKEQYDIEIKKEKELLKNIKIEDIDIKINGNYIEFPQFKNPAFIRRKNIFDFSNCDYLWKFQLSVVFELDLDTYFFISQSDFRYVINDVFKNLPNYFGLYYKQSSLKDDMGYYGYNLFLTKNKNEYIDKIKECRKRDIKIIYYNNNIKGGREFFDIENINKIGDANIFKKVSHDDMYFVKNTNVDMYILHFKDQSLDTKYKRLSNLRLDFSLTNDAQMDNNLFGRRIGHRFHMHSGLPKELKNIGLGYKIYKAFIKQLGYITSNTQVSYDAKNIYLKLIQDPYFYSIIDKNNRSPKVMIIDKNYTKIEELLKMVRDFEIKNNTKLIYDEELIKKYGIK